ncbi:hypothetical protein [Paenibacillus agricola]|uniref:Uncharacterized protein n=1 Tax=Paenibacillus agricola TaxID=2716264 RepID=A0ABX0JKD2_9BACL|nr:hypothetical protein [Paenibacillus agricola]NHN35338.1 hypothetical protein [Paenibacillus agricola]
MLVGNYNEYSIPNNNFLYKNDNQVSILRSKKSLMKIKQELKQLYGRKKIEHQPIFYKGIKTCLLAYIHNPFGNPSSIHYFLRHLDTHGLSREEYDPYTLDELNEIFNTNTCLIHIFDFGLISHDRDWEEFEAYYMNELVSCSIEL